MSSKELHGFLRDIANAKVAKDDFLDEFVDAYNRIEDTSKREDLLDAVHAYYSRKAFAAGQHLPDWRRHGDCCNRLRRVCLCQPCRRLVERRVTAHGEALSAIFMLVLLLLVLVLLSGWGIATAWNYPAAETNVKASAASYGDTSPSIEGTKKTWSPRAAYLEKNLMNTCPAPGHVVGMCPAHAQSTEEIALGQELPKLMRISLPTISTSHQMFSVVLVVLLFYAWRAYNAIVREAAIASLLESDASDRRKQRKSKSLPNPKPPHTTLQSMCAATDGAAWKRKDAKLRPAPKPGVPKLSVETRPMSVPPVPKSSNNSVHAYSEKTSAPSPPVPKPNNNCDHRPFGKVIAHSTDTVKRKNLPSDAAGIDLFTKDQQGSMQRTTVDDDVADIESLANIQETVKHRDFIGDIANINIQDNEHEAKNKRKAFDGNAVDLDTLAKPQQEAVKRKSLAGDPTAVGIREKGQKDMVEQSNTGSDVAKGDLLATDQQEMMKWKRPSDDVTNVDLPSTNHQKSATPHISADDDARMSISSHVQSVQSRANAREVVTANSQLQISTKLRATTRGAENWPATAPVAAIPQETNDSITRCFTSQTKPASNIAAVPTAETTVQTDCCAVEAQLIQRGDIVTVRTPCRAANAGYLSLREGMRIAVQYVGSEDVLEERGYFYGEAIGAMSQGEIGWFPAWCVAPILSSMSPGTRETLPTVDMDCLICMARHRTVLCIPCSHMPACSNCWTLLQHCSAIAESTPKCPVCRTDVEEVHSVIL